MCRQMLLVVQSSQKIEPQQELGFALVNQVKHEESAKPTWFRPTLKPKLAHHLVTIGRS